MQISGRTLDNLSCILENNLKQIAWHIAMCGICDWKGWFIKLLHSRSTWILLENWQVDFFLSFKLTGWCEQRPLIFERLAAVHIFFEGRLFSFNVCTQMVVMVKWMPSNATKLHQKMLTSFSSFIISILPAAVKNKCVLVTQNWWG